MVKQLRWWSTVAILCGLLGGRSDLQGQPDAQLLAAANKGDVAAAADAIAKGANVEAANDRGATALYVAAERGDLPLARLLLEHGANPNTRDLEWGRTPMRHASMGASTPQEKKDRAQIIALLLEKGGGADGESLDELIRGGHVDAARAIVARGGADPSSLNTALAAAKRARLDDVAADLVRAGARDPQPIDQPRSPERLRMLTGVYRSAAGQEVKLGLGIHEDQLLLEGMGPSRVALIPLDRTLLRSLDLKVVVTRKPGPLPPPALTVSRGGTSEVFTRVGEIASRSTETISDNRRPPEPAPTSRTPALPTRPSSPNWPSFRGADAAGVAIGARPPTTWDVEKGVNVRWKTPIPGLGHSSPIVWGNRVYVTTAIPETEEGVTFRYGQNAYSDVAAANRSTRDSVRYSWRVYALDRASGKIQWERVAREGVPQTARHVSQSQANSTPVTDGSRIVTWFGSEGLYCYDMDGKLLWKRDLGPLHSGYIVDPSYEWSTASSPVIDKNRVILQVDLVKGSFIAAFDLRTGQELWRTARDEDPSWGTPLVHETPSGTEIVTIAPKFARAYDPETGRELWRLGRHSVYAASTPIAGLGLLFLSSGGAGTPQPLYAVRPGARGDITLADDEASNRWVAWSKSRGGAAIATPIVYGDLLYVSSGGGALSVYGAETGERVYQERLTRGGTFTASPVAADGKVYFTSEDGDVIVVKAGRTFERLAMNSLGEPVLASAAISQDTIIFRTARHVVAFADTTPASAARPR